jgi:hypothetical protein
MDTSGGSGGGGAAPRGGGHGASTQWVKDSGASETSRTNSSPERVRTICHKVVAPSVVVYDNEFLWGWSRD